MQKICFKKMIDLNHNLKELISVSVDESINYKMENQGMRAYGCIMINGEYKNDSDKKTFSDSIDLDILAQYSKVEDKKEFSVKVEDFDYRFVDGNLALSIQACIYGVKDDEDREVIADVKQEEHREDDYSDEVEELLREESLEEIVVEDEVLKESLQKKPKVEKENHKEEVDNADMGTYYLYIVQDGDTYQSISKRYQVDEYRIKEYNHDRLLERGTIVIIPYFS